MKRFSLLFLTLLLAFTAPAVAQRRGTDLKANTKICKGLIPITRANTAATGAWCSLLGVRSAIAIAQGGLTDPTGAQYMVLQDSAVGVAVANIDSVDLGTTDSTTAAMAYNGSGRFIRLLLRASGAAADSTWASGVIILSDCAKKPC